MKEVLVRCPECALAGRSGWLKQDKKSFHILVCLQCGHRERERMNSVVEPHCEKRGFIMDAWSKVTKL